MTTPVVHGTVPAIPNDKGDTDSVSTLSQHVPFQMGEEVTVAQISRDVTGKIVGLGIMGKRPGILIRTDKGKTVRVTGQALYSVDRVVR